VAANRLIDLCKSKLSTLECSVNHIHKAYTEHLKNKLGNNKNFTGIPTMCRKVLIGKSNKITVHNVRSMKHLQNCQCTDKNQEKEKIFVSKLSQNENIIFKIFSFGENLEEKSVFLSWFSTEVSVYKRWSLRFTQYKYAYI